MSAKVLRIFLFVFFNDHRILDPTCMPFKEKRLTKKMQIFHGFYHKEIKNINVFSISNFIEGNHFDKNSRIAQNIRVCCHLLECFGIHI